MKLALYSKANGYEPSFTARQTPPNDFRWVGPFDDPAAFVATTESGRVMLVDARHAKRPSVWWRVEARWLETLMEAQFGACAADMVVSNRKEHVEAGASYMPLYGTWITQTEIPTKTENVSMIASGKHLREVEGYGLRRQVAMMMGGVMWPHGFGKAFLRPIRDKFPALAPYRFSIAIESEAYPWFHTEKLFDCFATKTVPLYWGCSDLSKLAEFGYDTSGILTWTTLDELRELLRIADEGFYETFSIPIEHNYRLTRENYCAEVPFARLLREKLGI